MPLTIDRFTAADLPQFLALAQAEQWICDQWEFDFLLRDSPVGCLVVRGDDQIPRGFVTAITYRDAGWIGNLLVAPDQRQRGMGRRLMEAAINYLEGAGAKQIWLTASPAGAPLYECLGFGPLGTIERWAGTGADHPAQPPDPPDFARMLELDAAAWGHSRPELLTEKVLRGEAWHNENGFLIRQLTESGLQIGPWAGTTEAAASLLKSAIAAPRSLRLLLDLPQANPLAGRLLRSHGFCRIGATILMCRGSAAGYAPHRLFALGTLGSIG